MAVLDVSGGGVLIESQTRLLPGIRVELQLMSANSVRRFPARVVRCQVASIRRVGGILYRAGLAFDRAFAAADVGERG